MAGNAERRHRILSLDGGGAWALIEVRALVDLYGPQATGHEVLRDFDLVVANSAGSIVAAGLYKNMPLGIMLDFFSDPAELKSIFVPLPWWRIWPVVNKLIGIGPKYSTKGKLAGLTAMMNDNATGMPVAGVRLRDLPKLGGGADLPHCVFCSFDYERELALLFRSDPKSRASGDPGVTADVSLLDAVHASTNATLIYFDRLAEVMVGGIVRDLWDGAFGGNNNPVLIGIMEAVANGIPAARIDALSIGSGLVFLPLAEEFPNTPAYLTQPRISQGFLDQFTEVAGCIMDNPPDAATMAGHLMLGGQTPIAHDAPPVTTGPLVRMNPLIQPLWNGVGWTPPGADYVDLFRRLVKMPADAMTASALSDLRAFSDRWISGPAGEVPNQPIRADLRTLEVEIGQRWYPQARAAWLARRDGTTLAA